ncbi:hypothetical protein M378DRAFT_902601 [Amanita muscaria Koide BX008]|uniref:DUF6534 domain-containing protein n=1 Tax=Amanita muscaria (strain Koide BX008) TaxID=946122 RepID=A0A0C2WHB2_AMAMK|nr:hypothetical protein M378DRAFT_902601 [Amanita muscaria Koide BX008]
MHPCSQSSPNMSQLMGNTYGAFLIGSLVATFASGMNALQTILYFRLYSEDPSKLKALVAVVLCLDIAHTGLLWDTLWYIFIEHFWNPYQIDVIPKPLLVPGTVIVGSTTRFIVHLFYLHRIFNLSHRNYWVSVPNLILILGDMGGTVAIIVIMYRYRLLSQLSDSSDAWMLSLGFIFAVAADIAIMMTLFVLLRLSRQQSISLNNAIDQLILYTLEMGSLTAFMAIAIMITWFKRQNSLVFLAIYLTLEKAYAIAFLGSLNTRYQLRRSQNSQNSHGQNMTNRVQNLVSSSERADISPNTELKNGRIDGYSAA